MSAGVIFDIKEMTVHDGPGLRVTVFLKGCPLRCKWCHNPEGLSSKPEVMRISKGCANCGKCSKPCSHRQCAEFGICSKICPSGLVRIVGEEVNSLDLAKRLMSYAPIFDKTGGGVTFSGGEPLMQPNFLIELLKQTDMIDTAVETCGYADEEAFINVVSIADTVLFDIKLIDPSKHRLYTGADNKVILKNLDNLIKSGKHFIVRLPMIPSVNDNEDHFMQVSKLIEDAKDRVSVEILPYNPLSGAKYMSLGLEHGFKYDKLIAPKLDPTSFFEDIGIPCRML